MGNFESSVKVIPYSQERVYNKLSDLSNLEAIKDRLPQDKVQDLSFDSDTLSFSVPPVGQLTLQIVGREPCKCIKLATANSPIPFNMWIQLVATGEEECKVKVTIRIDINPFMKAMVQKPLQDGLEKMVEMLAAINY
ncbi:MULTISPECIES: SRPBCC family protein [Bacteroides]|uniref:SRPBCC family protein n=1 Tax=Bacteroides TaxID=816 RepID=UPI002677327D|nr:SRPBCC family protein [Bacteroides acidifaciens]